MERAEIVDELLGGAYPCCLTTLNKSGTPYGVVVWCSLEGERLTVNAGEGHWLSNLRRDPRVSFVVVDTDNILRHVAGAGSVIEISDDSDYEHIDSLSRIYEGRRYQYSIPEQVPRFKVVIEPGKIRAQDYSPPEEEIR